MNKILIALTLTMATASAGAADWPWDDTAPKQPPQYCMGFVIGGLNSDEVSGMSRTDLWLAWNYVIRSGALDQATPGSEYTKGREKFQNVADATAAASVVQNADGDCGLGRTGHQITGW